MICSRCKKFFEKEKYKTCEKCRKYNKELRDKIPRTYKQGFYSSKDAKNKQCNKCLLVKSLEEFYKHKRYKDGYKNNCKKCHSIEWKEYYNNGYNLVLKEKALTDKVYKLKQNVKSYIHIQLKNRGKNKTSSCLSYIGCDIEFLYNYLKFSSRYFGENDYQIDHVIPLSLFNLEDKNAVKIAFNWANLQVLHKTENLKKYNNFSSIEYANHIINVHRYIIDTTHNFSPLKENLKYIKNNLLRHFQIAGTPLEP